MSKKLLAICHRIFLTWSEKRHFMCPEAQFGEEFIYCFGRNLVFPSASVHRDFFCGFRQDIFRSVTKNVFYVFFEKFWEKIGFSRERICFLSFLDFVPFFRHYSNFLGESSKLQFNCRNAFRGIFLKKVFCYSWARSKKIWSFLEEFPTGFSNFILRVDRKFLRNNLYFSGKNRFFSIIFEYWVVLFWRTRHNCMLLVQIRFKIK